MLKKILCTCLIAMYLIAMSACSTNQTSTVSLYNTTVLTARAIVVAQTYGTVSSIVKNNIELFSAAEQAKLNSASEAFNEMYITIKNLTGVSENSTTQEVLLSLAKFDYIYDKVKLSYTVVEEIVMPKMTSFTIEEQVTLTRFNSDIKLIAKQVNNIKLKLLDESSQLTGGQIDVTQVLQDLALIASALAQVIAVL